MTVEELTERTEGKRFRVYGHHPGAMKFGYYLGVGTVTLIRSYKPGKELYFFVCAYSFGGVTFSRRSAENGSMSGHYTAAAFPATEPGLVVLEPVDE